MNADVPPVPTPPRRRFRPFHWVLIFFAAGLTVMAVEGASIFFLARDARDLRSAIVDATEWDARREVQFSVGPGLLAVGRVATRWIEDIPDEARSVLKSLRSVSVGVYTLERSPTSEERVAMIESTDRRLLEEGWHRVVGVNDGNDTVLVYLIDEDDLEEDIEMCVAVCDGQDLVLVSARGLTEPLLEIVEMHRAEWGWRNAL